MSAPPKSLVSPAPNSEGPPGFDLVVSGGEVIDPASGRRGPYDVAIADGRIAAIAPRIEPNGAAVIDARGCLVTPGLVDLHTHVYAGGGFWSLRPEPVAWRSGVTCFVDAGSAGAYNAGALLDQIATSPLGLAAFLNISSRGLVTETGEARSASDCDAALCAEVLAAHPGVLVGVKSRLDHHAVGPAGLEPLRQARSVAQAAGVPVMVHIGGGPPEIDEVLGLLSPGDLVTHACTGQSMALLDEHGALRPAAASARERGVLLDLGHGSGAFSYAVAEQMAARGEWPDVISSDLHLRSVLGPAFDLPTCASKLLALGMPLEQVIAAMTLTPARVAKRADQWGALALGRRADVAIFRLERVEVDLFDTYLVPRRVDQLLVNVATIASGVVLEPLPPEPLPPWIEATAAQRRLVARPPSELRRPWAEALQAAEDFARLAIGTPPRYERGGR
ncbi:MAG: amidohydrolase/deacetylase family metallohydrolase [Actinomycetota bacterium]|nr:amidohydrolase/deacetylase family metallohydrolase [Actinomycetota bacterium]